MLYPGKCGAQTEPQWAVTAGTAASSLVLDFPIPTALHNLVGPGSSQGWWLGPANALDSPTAHQTGAAQVDFGALQKMRDSL